MSHCDTTHNRPTGRFENTAPELALLYKLNSEWLFRGRVATGYGTPQVSNLFVLPTGHPATTPSSRRRRISATISASTGRRTRR